ncbi:MAG: hypothetical protein KC466_21045, partial [Myxococcales bacterium]|nr:hypothetical protein [Myxococcales bacterium]
AALVDPPFSLPGERSVARGIVDDLPPGLVAAIEGRVLDELGPLLGGLPPGEGLADLIRVLLGDDTEVANFFAVDPASGRLWVAATAPDAEDGTVDGVSELGALYGLDLVASGSGFAITEVCHRSFPGGSASTPALRADGARIYVGDNDGRLIAINPDCSDAWTLDVGAQIIGSVGVASDNGELYVATARDVVQVIDLGAGAVEGWRAGLWAMYESGPILANTNVNLYSIAANGVGFQGGVGLQVAGFTLPVSTGVGLLDRETGAVRYFTPGFEETVAAMSTGPDGAMYIGHSPVRRAIARALAPEVVPPLVGGVGKYAPRRQDLLVRDAACAGADRAANAASVVAICPDSAHADVDQINGLIAQARAAGPRAVAAGELSSAQWADLDAALVDAEGAADSGNLESLRDRLAKACDFFS